MKRNSYLTALKVASCVACLLSLGACGDSGKGSAPTTSPSSSSTSKSEEGSTKSATLKSESTETETPTNTSEKTQATTNKSSSGDGGLKYDGRTPPISEIPEKYAKLKSPYTEPSEEILAEGKALFMTAKGYSFSTCESCHGATGIGDGGSAPSYSQGVSNLTWEHLAEYPDSYFFWRVRVGFIPSREFDQNMPALASGRDISDDDLWKLIAYVRTFHQK